MGSNNMTDKQIAFQRAEKAFVEAQEAVENAERTRTSPDYGHNMKRAQEEAIEAETQIEKAISVSSETQKERLLGYREELETLKQQIEWPEQ